MFAGFLATSDEIEVLDVNVESVVFLFAYKMAASMMWPRFASGKRVQWTS